MSIDEIYILRCLQIAKNGLGSTRPNPMVGAIIVKDNCIIGEGVTSKYGGPHAEVNAINAVKDPSLLKDATIYVTLEPCSHYGKTPPCSDLIIEHKIQRVVIGCIDDNPEVAGRGVKRLIEHGCDVVVGVLENECKAHHKRFFTFHNKQRPYVILKWAESNDGYIAPNLQNRSNEAKPVWLSNTYSRQLVHKWRAKEQAILVGTNTVIDDNPLLTVRNWSGNHPTRLVIDAKSKLDSKYNIFDASADTIRITDNLIDFKKPIAQQICTFLYQRGINSLLIEGGAKTLQTFIDENLWDEARVFTSTVELKDGIKAPTLSKAITSKKVIESDILNVYAND